METQSKKPYENPKTVVYSVKPEGIICQSPESLGIESMRSGYGQAQEDQWD